MANAEDDEWHELDQAVIRKDLYLLMRNMMPDEYPEKVVALKQFFDIAREVASQAVNLQAHLFIRAHPKSTREDAARLVATIERDLHALGLGLELSDDPHSTPSRLRLAATPPSN